MPPEQDDVDVVGFAEVVIDDELIFALPVEEDFNPLLVAIFELLVEAIGG